MARRAVVLCFLIRSFSFVVEFVSLYFFLFIILLYVEDGEAWFRQCGPVRYLHELTNSGADTWYRVGSLMF